MVLTRRQTEAIAEQTQKSPDEILQLHAQGSFAERLNGNVSRQLQKETPLWVYLLLTLFTVLSMALIPQPFHPTAESKITILHVFYYGWLTAMSTGLGALPFLLFPDIGSFWVGISNGTLL